MSEQNLTVTENTAIGPGFTARMRRWRTQVVTVSVSRSSSAARKPNLTMTLRTWHKRAGLFAFIFMGWLGASGVLINQSADWGYDTVRIDWTWVMSLYSLKPSPPRSGFASDGHWIAATPESTVMDGKALPDHVANPVGFAVGGTPEAPLMFVAGGDKLLLYTPEGARVDGGPPLDFRVPERGVDGAARPRRRVPPPPPRARAVGTRRRGGHAAIQRLHPAARLARAVSDRVPRLRGQRHEGWVAGGAVATPRPHNRLPGAVLRERGRHHRRA